MTAPPSDGMTGPSDGTGRTTAPAPAPSSSRDTPLVFPVGHYLGPFHPAVDAPARYFVVRVGWETPRLPDEAHLDVWALAHGLPARIDSTPWTRKAVLEAAEDAGRPGADGVVDRLHELGVLVSVPPRGPETVTFAQAHRMRTLLMGLGAAPDDPGRAGIGLAGLPAVARVRPRVFELWAYGHLFPSIWSACEGFADVARETGVGDPGDDDPEQQLAFVMDALRILLASNAVYLDVVDTRPHEPSDVVDTPRPEPS